MATLCAVEPGNKRKRRRILATITIAFILSTTILWYARLIPLPLPRATTAQPFASVEDNPFNQESLISRQQQEAEEEKTQATVTMAPTMAGHRPHKNKDKDGGLIRLATLPPAHLPTPAADSPRLIIIGDVHGQLAALETLLSKVEFSRARGDHVVFVGDMVNKGPDSSGVVDLAMSIEASAVRGNHEDRVLRAYDWEEERARQKGGRSSSEEEYSEEEEEEEEEEGHHEEAEGVIDVGEESKREKGKGKGKGKKRKGKGKEKFKEPKPNKEDRATAASLTPAQRSWLAELPVILRVGAIAPYGDVLVVHGGLVPGVPLEEQNLQAVMNMRSLVPRRKLKKSWCAQNGDPATSFLGKEDAADALKADYINDDGDDDHDTNEEEEEEAVDYEGIQTHTQHRLSTLTLHPPPASAAATRDRDRALVPSETHHGRPWAKAWDSAQRRAARRADRAGDNGNTATTATTMVIYGHDARTGLAVREYALGLDSGCVRGGDLTAAVFEAVAASTSISTSGNEDNGGGESGEEDAVVGEKGKGKGGKVIIRRQLVSVACEAWDGKDGKDGKKGKKGKGKKGKGKKDKEDKGKNHKHKHKDEK